MTIAQLELDTLLSEMNEVEPKLFAILNDLLNGKISSEELKELFSLDHCKQ